MNTRQTLKALKNGLLATGLHTVRAGLATGVGAAVLGVVTHDTDNHNPLLSAEKTAFGTALLHATSRILLRRPLQVFGDSDRTRSDYLRACFIIFLLLIINDLLAGMIGNAMLSQKSQASTLAEDLALGCLISLLPTLSFIFKSLQHWQSAFVNCEQRSETSIIAIESLPQEIMIVVAMALDAAEARRDAINAPGDVIELDIEYEPRRPAP